MSAKGWKSDRPYNTLPALPPKLEVETRAVLKQCITARAALAGLKQAAELIPNQAVLINTLPLLEARASSEIENIVTTTDQLFRHLRNEEQADPATKEALRYSRALFEGGQGTQEISVDHAHCRANMHPYQGCRDDGTPHAGHDADE
jgi:Fic family protein